jgi:DnaJ-domain-containing protein 1
VPRLFLFLAIAAVIYILYKRAQGMPAHKRKAEYTKLALGLAVAAVVGLTLAGKMHWLGAAFTGLLVAARQLLPTAIRLFPMLASLRSKNAASTGQSSTVETAVLRMHMEHDTGALDGEVLRGEFLGWQLSAMDKSQLHELVAYCDSEDADSLALLDSYLQQRFANDGSFEQASQAAPGASSMNRAEALAVLGLPEGAGREDIIASHRKLMQKIHPDRGGNDYLAAKLNQAKDLLLG